MLFDENDLVHIPIKGSSWRHFRSRGGANLQVGSGDLPELPVIFRAQISVPLKKWLLWTLWCYTLLRSFPKRCPPQASPHKSPRADNPASGKERLFSNWFNNRFTIYILFPRCVSHLEIPKSTDRWHTDLEQVFLQTWVTPKVCRKIWEVKKNAVGVNFYPQIKSVVCTDTGNRLISESWQQWWNLKPQPGLAHMELRQLSSQKWGEGLAGLPVPSPNEPLRVEQVGGKTHLAHPEQLQASCRAESRAGEAAGQTAAAGMPWGCIRFRNKVRGRWDSPPPTPQVLWAPICTIYYGVQCFRDISVGLRKKGK